MQFLLISNLLRDGCIDKFGCVDAQFVEQAASDVVGLTIRLPLWPRCCEDSHVSDDDSCLSSGGSSEW